MKRIALFAAVCVSACSDHPGAVAAGTYLADVPTQVTAHAVVALDDSYLVAWLGRDPLATNDQMWLARVAPDASVIDPAHIVIDDVGAAKNVALARQGDRVLLAWLDGDIQSNGDVWARRITVVALDLAGQLMTATAVVSTVPYYYRNDLSLAAQVTSGVVGFIGSSALPRFQTFDGAMSPTSFVTLSTEISCGVCAIPLDGGSYSVLFDDRATLFESIHTNGSTTPAAAIAAGACPHCTAGPSGELGAVWLDKPGLQLGVRDGSWRVIDLGLPMNRAESQDRGVVRVGDRAVVAWQGDHEYALGQIYVTGVDLLTGSTTTTLVSDPRHGASHPELAARACEALLVYIMSGTAGATPVAYSLPW